MSENECTKFVKEKKEPVKKEEPKEVEVVQEEPKEEIPNQKICTKVQTQSPVKVQDNEDKNVKDKNVKDIENKNENINNKGTGAGGSNTNKNGLSYEVITELKDDERYKIKEKIQINKKSIQIVEIDDKKYFKLKKGDLKLYMEQQGEYKKQEKSLQPDESYVDDVNKIINIIEKKFQQTPGSVDEKIQTASFKKWFYVEQYPNYKIKYCYCLSDWFKQDKYKPDMRYLSQSGFKVFWGSDTSYQKNILDWIVND